MKKATCILLAAGWLALASCGGEAEDRPNILLIVADDLGWRDVGFMGSGYYETPHLDRLAAGGRVFTQAYASAANCAPSRACLMSGRYTPYHGIYTVGSSERGDPRTRRIVPAVNSTVLDSSVYTLAEALKDAGYRTCHVGKWHLGEDPRTQGMDRNVGGSHWGAPGSYFAPYGRPPLEAPEGECLTDRLTREALAFLGEEREAPFFLYLPYYAVHTPIQSKPELQEKYGKKTGDGCQARADYAGMVENLDANIGEVMRELERLNLAENTLVIFTSDNGGIRSISCQDPLRAGKGSYYEGGIRVPLVFHWEAKILPGRTEAPAMNLDFFPTLMDLLNREAGVELDGISLWPLLEDGIVPPERRLFFHFPVYLQAYDQLRDDGRDPLFRTRPGSVIRKGPWKLHLYYEDSALELYNLDDDPGEQDDLSGINTSKTKELSDELEAWLEDQKAPRRFPENPVYDPDYEQEQVRKH
jgi:arylsulfatase A-like enzyme